MSSPPFKTFRCSLGSNKHIAEQPYEQSRLVYQTIYEKVRNILREKYNLSPDQYDLEEKLEMAHKQNYVILDVRLKQETGDKTV